MLEGHDKEGANDYLSVYISIESIHPCSSPRFIRSLPLTEDC